MDPIKTIYYCTAYRSVFRIEIMWKAKKKSQRVFLSFLVIFKFLYVSVRNEHRFEDTAAPSHVGFTSVLVGLLLYIYIHIYF